MAEIFESKEGEKLGWNDNDRSFCVFSCDECREILGDSLSSIWMNQDLHFICLQEVTDAVTLSTQCETSVDDLDKGSSYNILECKLCHSSIGRYYNTTPKLLDCIRENYTLDLNKVRSYQLGSYTNPSTRNALPVDHKVEKVKETIMQIQSVVLSLDERLGKLESYFEEIEVSGDQADEELTKNSQKKKRKIK